MHEIYSKPPIAEAVLDIFCKNPQGLSLETLRSAQLDVQDDYPICTERFRMKVQGAADSGTPLPSGQFEREVNGYAFSTKDGHRLWQARFDGFSANILRPYTHWSDFKAQSQRLWDLYRLRVQPEFIGMIGLQYLNKIPIPHNVDFGEYVNLNIDIPPGLPQMVESYAYRIQFKAPESEDRAVVSAGLEPSDRPNIINLVITIQVFNNFNAPVRPDTQAPLWLNFDNLRQFKDLIFEQIITDKVREDIR